MRATRLLAAFLVYVGLAWARPASAAIAVTFLNSTQNTSNTTLTLSSLTIPANALGIVTGFARKNASGDTFSVADSAGNNYTVVPCPTAGNAANIAFVAYFRYGGTGLTSGSITSTASVLTAATTFGVSYATGIQAVSPEDTSVQACPGTPTTSTTAPTITSGTPTMSGDLMINVIGKPSTSAGFSDTEDAANGWTTLGGTGNSSIVAVGAYAINSGSGTKVHAPTMNSATWTQQIVGFFDAAGVPASTARRGALLGVGQ